MEMTIAEQIRTYVKALQPVDLATLVSAMGLPHQKVKENITPMLKRGHMLLDDGRYALGKPVQKIAGSGKYSRINRASGNYSKQAANAEVAQAMNHKAIGIPGGVVSMATYPDTAAFIAAHPERYQVLGNGDVSKGSRFERIAVPT
jgi:hypothetical protein